VNTLDQTKLPFLCWRGGPYPRDAKPLLIKMSGSGGGGGGGGAGGGGGGTMVGRCRLTL